MNTLDLRKQKALTLIDQSIQLVNSEICKGNDTITVNSMKKILYELETMKKELSPTKFMPTYGYIIADSWQDFTVLGEKLLETANYYKKKLK
ncbi:MAG: hypothetical protein WBL93_06645 [Lutisporaceae bacterium]